MHQIQSSRSSHLTCLVLQYNINALTPDLNIETVAAPDSEAMI